MNKSFFSSRFFRFVLCVLSFGIVAWSEKEAPFFQGCAAFFGYALFWYAISFSSIKRIVFYSFLWFLGIGGIWLFWMVSLRYQPIAIIFLYGFLCCLIAAQFAFVTYVLFSAKKISVLRLLSVASLWVLLEWGRLFILCGFTFHPVGLALSGHYIPLQFATVLGVFGLSFLVILTNLFAFRAFRFGNCRNVFMWISLGIFPYFFGLMHVAYQKRYAHEEHKKLTAVLVQTGLRVEEKDPVIEMGHLFVPPQEQWTRIFSYVQEAAKGSLDFIVLPESALPFGRFLPVYPWKNMEEHLKGIIGSEYAQYLPPLDSKYVQKVNGEMRVTNAFYAQVLSNVTRADVIIGLDDYDGEHYFNAAFFFRPDQVQPMRYEKRILVPIVEYFPTHLAKKIAALFDIMGEFSPGKDMTIFPSQVPIAPSICYEETFGHVMREGRKKGAELYVNLTNDVWFFASSLPQHHFALAKLRTIENGVPLLRACNTGVTSAIDSLGRPMGRIQGEMTKGALRIEIPLRVYPTLYTLWGDYAIVGLSLVFISLSLLKNRRL
ncbi:MAG: apolipoprotein N-acyltransferase [Parachlamydiales bacterium]|nr:apolipoprotein N-acyltransferase [Parachlamydiales bacterium]